MDKNIRLNDIEKVLKSRVEFDKYKTLKSLPKPDLFKDMQKATKRIVQAIKKDEQIYIIGDYDVDGVVSTAILIEFFNTLGVRVKSIIPNRFIHGYGLSPTIVETIDNGLVITVDNGISAFEAAILCKEKGLDLVITDHHTVGDTLPIAYAIINPKQKDCHFPFKDICGAQVAWYLCASIKKELNIEYNLGLFFDILALAIVADIMPMISLNQTMVRYGLSSLKTTQRVPIVVLRERYGLKNINEDDIGFKFAPLINCAGRMEDASLALNFLLSKDIKSANKNLDILIELNEKRKQEQLNIFNEAKIQVDQNDDVIVVSDPSWNEGIIGIVASKLCEKYKKPSFVFTINNDISKASSRSIQGIDLYNLILKSKDILIGFGGHKQAAGLSIQTSKLDCLKKELNKNILFLEKDISEDINDSLGVLSLDDVNENIFNLIESYRPYGHSNPYPLFTFKNIKILNITKMGKNKEFTKLIVTNDNSTIEVVIFNDFDSMIKIGDIISFIATVSKNEFRGNISYNLMLKEVIS